MARVVLSKIFTLDQIQSIAKEILALSSSHCWCFYGDLGAGKTTLISAMISEMIDMDPHEISSPTFVYLHEYENVCHFDLYRLTHSSEFEKMGFDEYFDRPCFIEWAEKIQPILPNNRVEIIMKEVGENQREINVVES